MFVAQPFALLGKLGRAVRWWQLNVSTSTYRSCPLNSRDESLLSTGTLLQIMNYIGTTGDPPAAKRVGRSDDGREKVTLELGDVNWAAPAPRRETGRKTAFSQVSFGGEVRRYTSNCSMRSVEFNRGAAVNGFRRLGLWNENAVRDHACGNAKMAREGYPPLPLRIVQRLIRSSQLFTSLHSLCEYTWGLSFGLRRPRVRVRHYRCHAGRGGYRSAAAKGVPTRWTSRVAVGYDDSAIHMESQRLTKGSEPTEVLWVTRTGSLSLM
jgi:hypothetical protein